MAKIAYVMSRFPHLPETFILREMNEMLSLGWDVQLYPLIFQQQPVVHADAKPWMEKAHSPRYLDLDTLRNNGRMFLKNPGRYCAVLGIMVVQNWRSPNFLIRSLALFPRAVSFAWLMQQENIDHVHAHYASHPALVAWIVYSLTGIPYSLTVHAHDIFARTEMLGTKLRQARFVVAISEFNREYISHLVGDEIKDKTTVIHCGISPEQYPVSQSTWPDTPDTVFQLLSVGSLKKIKGQIFLAQACKILADRKIPFHCRIVGMGNQFEEIHRFIQENHLEDRVEILGDKTQEEVAQILPTAHCFVQPSLAEGLPVAVMEALACDLPVVATAISGTVETMAADEPGYPIRKSEMPELSRLLSVVYRNRPESVEMIRAASRRLASGAGIHELIIPGQTGYLVPPADPLALADAIEAVYLNYADARRMSANGRNLVLENFDLHRNGQLLSGLFTRMIRAG